MTLAGHEAAAISGGSKGFATGHQIMVNAMGSTAAGVGAYQLNSHLAKIQKQPAPELSVQTGQMPNNTGATISKAASRTRKKYTKKKGT